MIDYIKKNHLGLLIIIGLIVSAYFGLMGKTVIVENLGAINRDSTTISNPHTFQQGVTINANANGTGNALTVSGTSTFSGEVTLGDEIVKWEELTIGSGDDDDFVSFSAQATTTVDLVEVGFNSGTASSSYDVFLFATTSTAVANTLDYTSLSYTTNLVTSASHILMPTFTYATSTTGTTTNSFIRTIPNGEAVIPPGYNIVFYIQQGDLLSVDDNSFEPATSTARGISSFTAKFRYHR